MKVAVVIDTYPPDVSGVVNTVVYLEKYFEKLGLEYKLFCPGNPEENDEKHHFFKGMKFLFYDQLHFAFVIYPIFKSAIEAYKPDVVHVITEGPLGLHAQHYARDEKIPFIASYTTNLPLYAGLYTFEAMKPLMEAYVKHVHQHAVMNLVPSEHSKAQLEEMGLENNVIWKRGIDTEKYYPNPERKLEKKKNLLYVGRVALEKKIDVLIRLAELLNEKNYDFTLHIVGDGPILEDLKGKNTPNVIYHGFKRGEELYEMYRNQDVFVFSSESETYGNVIMEAMASGLPVISIFKGGVTENVKDGFNGYAIMENEAEEYVKALDKLFESEEHYWTLSKNAREYTLQRSWETLTKELLELYKEAYEKRQ
ncbi:glycosyltransferase family 4 protein [Guggenheimella bovis]